MLSEMKSKLVFLALFLFVVLPWVEAFEIVGYIPDYKAYDVSSIQFDKVTVINYAFLIPTSSGGVLPLERPGQLEQIVSQAHAHGVKVCIAVGGWALNGTPLDSTFETLAGSAAGRNNLVNNIVNIVNQYNLDGADMDWEFPDPPQEGNGSADNFQALMESLSNAMHSRGKIATAAVHAGATPDVTDFYWAYGVKNEVFAVVDFLNIMAYDGGDGQRHSPYSLAENVLNYWVGIRGLPGYKAILGVPFYARPSWAGYSDLVAADANAPYVDHITYQGMDAWYNGIQTIKSKTNLALSRGGGIMIWELSFDTAGSTSLLLAINQAAGGSTSTPPPTPPTTTPAPTATPPGGTCTNPAWNASTVYNGGNLVSHENHTWRARWWTQGEEPGTTGQWGVWEDLGACSGSGTTPTPTPPATPGPTVAPTPTPPPTPTPSPTPDGSVPAWQTGVYYASGDLVTYNGSTWRCTYAHTSNAAWYPGAPGLWFWEAA